jgi:hypothetical protein
MTKQFFPKLLIIFCISVVSISTALAQNAEIRGFLYDAQNGEPLIFTNVYLKGTNFGSATDVNGYFSITKIPAGSYNLMIKQLGYDSISENITLNKGQVLTKKYVLNPAITELTTVEIKGNRMNSATDVNVAVTKVSPKDIKIMPTIGGEPDLAQFLQTLPGVVFSGDQGGQLYIRGGTPVQNLTLLDGMIVYNPFHSIGLFSVFDTDIIRSADIYTGGFGAEYGGRVSAVMDIVTKDGNKKRFGGKISGNPFMTKTILEGPLGNSKKEGGSPASFLINSRTSYIDRVAPTIYSYVPNNIPFNFNDLYGKITLSSESGSKLNLFGFRFTDKVKLGLPSTLGWNSFGFGTNFLLLPDPSSSLIMGGNFAYSSYKINIEEAASAPRFSEINNFNLGLNFTYFIKKNELKFGLNTIGNTTNYEASSLTGIKSTQQKNNTELAAFVKYKIVTRRLLVEPSLRLHFYPSLGDFSPEPRIGLKYNLTDRIRLKFAGGLYSQNLIDTRSDRDVVNLFTGFLSSPDALYDANGKRIENRLQKATHAIGGIEIDLRDNLELNIEPYAKIFNKLVNVNRERMFSSDPEFIVESGLTRGIDLFLKYSYKKFYVQTGYSYSVSDRTYGTFTYSPTFDRRHNANIVSAYSFGKNGNMEVSMRWNLGSGFPFTPTQGFYEYLSASQGIDADFINSNGTLGVLYGELNSKRLPYYHRLDLSFRKRFVINPNNNIELNAGVINGYNRRNIFYFDRITSKRVDQLPFLPTVGVTWDF